MVVITNDKKEADETKRVVTQQEADANIQADKAKSIAEDAQRDLDAALPALEKAVESLKNLSRNDVVEVKALQNPPMGVKLVMEATSIMFDEKPKMVADPNNVGKKVGDLIAIGHSVCAAPLAHTRTHAMLCSRARPCAPCL